jgi:hypothetical protein
MSKSFKTIQDAIIIKTEKVFPRRWYKQDTAEFSNLTFDICEVFGKKNAQGEWDKPSFMSTKCTIWNEKIADKFMEKLESIDPKHKAYITIIHGVCTGFDTHEVDATTKEGKIYKLNTYSNMRMSVSEFVITSKPINEQYAKDQDIEDNDTIDDAIPFSI